LTPARIRFATPRHLNAIEEGDMIQPTLREPPMARMSDAEVVRIAAHILRDPRAWAAAGTLDPHGLAGRQVRARALALLAETLETV
jgi:hypothetical protein